MTELWQLHAVDLARLIRTGRASATEATKSVLAPSMPSSAAGTTKRPPPPSPAAPS